MKTQTEGKVGEVATQAKTAADVIAQRRERLAVRSGYRSLFIRLLLIGAVAYVFFAYMFLITQVSGMDMFPAMKDGDLVIVFRLQQEYAKDDVIAYQSPDGRRFGRIAARAGDVISMDDSGAWLVNGTTQSGEILYPTYAVEGIQYPYRVPDGCVFVLGDYRTKATDSRTYAAIPMADVEGKAITILRRRGL